MGAKNSRNLVINKEEYSERVPTYTKKFSQDIKENQHLSSKGFDNSFDPTKTDFVKNLSSNADEKITESELKELREIYNEKLKALHDENGEIHGATMGFLSSSISRIERKCNAIKKTICGECQNEMVSCFKKNKGEILTCVESVQKFNSCLQAYRSKEGMVLIQNKIEDNLNNTNNTAF